MKRTILISLALILVVLLLSNFCLDNRTNIKSSLSMMDEPVLPDIPYDYTVTNIPDYLTDGVNPITYFVDGFSSTDLDQLDNDIVTLGRVLFYDKKLSFGNNEELSCASCHHQANSFADSISLSEGFITTTQRNTLHLNDLGWSNSKRFSWDMEQTSLYSMIVLPVTDGNMIGANLWEIAPFLEVANYYPNLFEKAYGEPYITNDRILVALEQFIISMTTFNTKYDQAAPEFQGFTESEKRGMDIFRLSCTKCHTQGNSPGFGTPPSPNNNNNNGLIDSLDVGAGDWNSSFDDLYKLSTLRNIELTAPYMHDGRFSTLEKVIEYYSSGVVGNAYTDGLLPDGGYNFNDQQKEDLIAFLGTLTDTTIVTDVRWSDPFTFTSSTKNLAEFEDVIISPNPMTHQAIIKFKNTRNQQVTINILSSDGRLIQQEQTTSNQYTIQKSSLESGLYYLELINDEAKSVKKLVVQ